MMASNSTRALGKSVLHGFNAPIRVLVAYGSAVKAQAGQKADDSMVDFIFGVEDAREWHDVNLKQHPLHYATAMLLGGSRFVAWVQALGAGVFYNTLVPFEGRRIKYGVVTTERLEHDMRQWDDMYLSGRLHKPVDVICSTPSFDKALTINRTNALQTALLMLPPTFTQEQLFTTIAGLSYAGDFRMTYGENPYKVANIVKGQFDEFSQIYLPLLREVSPTSTAASSSQDQDPDVQALRLALLPSNFQLRIQRFWEVGTRQTVGNLSEVAMHPDRSKYILQALHAINSKSSRSQSVKGIFTAGVSKSLLYVSEKLQKRAKALESPPKA